MGVGKTTFVQLLNSYQGWLQSNYGLDHDIFHSFPEELPGWWSEYIFHKDRKIPHESIYNTQIWFAQKKIEYILQAAGYSSLGVREPHDRRPSGIHLVDRSLHEDFYVFAGGLKNLFPEGRFDDYVRQIEASLDQLPNPDLVIRLCVERPEVSQRRVQGRGYGEQLRLSRYHEMAESYQEKIDPWIESLGVPVISIRTDLPHFDFDTAAGQNFFLWSLLNGLFNNTNATGRRLWNMQANILPQEMLIHPNNS